MVSLDLTDEEVRQYHDRGYVFLEGAIDGEELEDLQSEADRLLELVVNASLANDRPDDRLHVAQVAEDEQHVRKIQPYLDLSKAYFELATDEEFLRPLQQVWDDEPTLLEESCKLNYKQPLPEPLDGIETEDRDDRFPIHSDWEYYEEIGFPEGIATTIVFLDDVAEDSGPLQIWPGTHTRDLEHEEVDIGKQVVPEDLDYDAGETVLGPAGSVLFFDSRLAHSSSPNTSGRPRRFLIFGHYPRGNETDAVSDQERRLRETAYEWEYQRKKERGEYEDAFTAPATD